MLLMMTSFWGRILGPLCCRGVKGWIRIPHPTFRMRLYFCWGLETVQKFIREFRNIVILLRLGFSVDTWYFRRRGFFSAVTSKQAMDLDHPSRDARLACTISYFFSQFEVSGALLSMWPCYPQATYYSEFSLVRFTPFVSATLYETGCHRHWQWRASIF